MSSASLGEALSIGIRYAPMIGDIFRFHLRAGAERASLAVEELVPLGAAGHLLTPSLLIALWRMGDTFTGRALVGDLELRMPEPPEFAQYAGLAPGVVRFGQPCDRLLFDRAYLDLPLVTADACAARAARESCESKLKALARANTLEQRVKQLLFAADGCIRSPKELAQQLAMSERTLKRRLAEKHTTYTELLDRARHARALELLRTGSSVEEASERLGYSDAANFTRAFRRWTGQSPRALRRSERPTP
jgi:AraC-like DNA-binding protein